MVLTKRTLRKWLQGSFIHISRQREAEILAIYGQEPGDGFQWTEQDIYEQVRKMLP